MSHIAIHTDGDGDWIDIDVNFGLFRFSILNARRSKKMYAVLQTYTIVCSMLRKKRYKLYICLLILTYVSEKENFKF